VRLPAHLFHSLPLCVRAWAKLDATADQIRASRSNLKTATVPDKLLALADEVIE
jgi:hypothetical protein